MWLLTSVSQDAIDTVLGASLVLLQLPLLDLIVVLLVLADSPELGAHDAADCAYLEPRGEDGRVIKLRV